MSITIRNNAKLYENYNINGRKEYYLVIECNNCNESNSDFFHNYKCIACLLINIYKSRDKKFKEILIKSKELNINYEQLKKLLNYFKKLKIIKGNYKKIENFNDSKCNYKEFNCKISQGIKKFKELDYIDPFIFFKEINDYYELVNKVSIINTNCQNCIKTIKYRLEILLKLLNYLEIIKFYNSFKTEYSYSRNFGVYYEKLFLKKNIFQDIKMNDISDSTSLSEKMIKIYNLGAPPLFQISIFEESDEYEKKYKISLYFNSKSEEIFFKTVIQDILNNLDKINFDKIISLPNLIKLYNEVAEKFLDLKYKKLMKEEKERLAYLTTLKKLNLEKLFPLLIDDNVEEIFLDSPFDNIYLNHQEFGRCITTLKLNLIELERIKTFLRIYSGQRLDYSNPSLKFVIKNNLFYCRFAIDVDPLHIDRFGLDIRKMNKNILSIQDLLKNNTLNPEIAAFLYFCVLKRINITITGQTDTGKTTLINALDLITPKDFRKIYIEDTIESLNQRQFGKHQLKYLVDSDLNDDNVKQFSKSNQIKTLLHRSPDLIYLGEILTKEEAQAMFHCLASGLSGFQTIHSMSIQSLLNRFIHFFKIEPSCLNDLGIIVFMRKIDYKRQLISISEIIEKDPNLFKNIHDIFHYDPASNTWILTDSLYNTHVLKNIKNFEIINEKVFNDYMDVYREIFTWLYNRDKINNDILVSFFHKISFYSMNSVNKLKLFWIKWEQSQN